MSEIATFFAGSGTEFGVFYPAHCLAAVFEKLETAEKVGRELAGAGFAESDVLVASGRQVLDYDRDHLSVGKLIMRAMSRFFKTEQAFADHDLEHARQGAGFVVVRCPKDAEKNAAWRIVGAADPLDARYYATGAIEHLAGDADTD
jgi:hypothetical protein